MFFLKAILVCVPLAVTMITSLYGGMVMMSKMFNMSLDAGAIWWTLIYFGMLVLVAFVAVVVDTDYNDKYDEEVR